MGYLADREVNRGRQPEIDCLKAFCIVPMILLHTFETCAAEPGGFYHAVHLLEALTGAAAFMLCMGLGMRYSRHQTPQAYAHRGIGLLTGAQLLYLLRNAIPSLIAWWGTGNKVFIANALLIFETDIMTFAGLAFLLLALFSKLRLRGRTVFLASLGMNAAAFLLSKVFRSTGNYLADQMLGWFVFTEAESYFPLCCYFVFAAAGYWLGEIYPRILDKDRLSIRVLAFCLPTASAYYILRSCVTFPGMPAFFTAEQYILNPLTDAVANCTMAVALLAAFHQLLKLGKGQAPGYVNHLSKHINQYYCISYVLAWPTGTLLYAVRGELMPGNWLPLAYAVLVIAVTWLIIEWNEKHLHLHFNQKEGRKRIAVYAAIWIVTVLIVAYAYPKTDVYANVWTDYLMR